MTAKLYKWLDVDGCVMYGGHGQWPLPHDGQPGEWMPPIQGELVPCRRGYHLCHSSDLPLWIAPRLFEAEYRGERLDVADKIVVREARLIREITAWNRETMISLAADFAEHVLPLFERHCPDDNRPRKAIAVARKPSGPGVAARAARAAWEAGAAWVAARAAWEAAVAWVAEAAGAAAEARAAGEARAAVETRAAVAARAARAARAAWAAGAAWVDWVTEAAGAAMEARAAVAAWVAEAARAAGVAARMAQMAEERIWQGQQMVDVLGLNKEVA